jgi:hypothetical protein
MTTPHKRLGTLLHAQRLKRFLGIGVSVVILGAVLVLSRPLSPVVHRPDFAVWNVSSLQRISPTDPPRSGTQVQLSAARGETESFQIVTGAPDSHDIQELNITVSDLTSRDGKVISKSNFQLYREHYVYISADQSSPNWHGSNQPLGPGWYPDGLIPFADPFTGAPLSGAKLKAAPYNLSAGKNQPFWIDIFVPRKCSTGSICRHLYGHKQRTSDYGSHSAHGLEF